MNFIMQSGILTEESNHLSLWIKIPVILLILIFCWGFATAAFGKIGGWIITVLMLIFTVVSISVYQKEEQNHPLSSSTYSSGVSIHEPPSEPTLLINPIAVDELLDVCAVTGESMGKQVYVTVAPDNTATCAVIGAEDVTNDGQETAVPSGDPVLTSEEVALKERELNERLFSVLARKYQ